MIQQTAAKQFLILRLSPFVVWWTFTVSCSRPSVAPGLITFINLLHHCDLRSQTCFNTKKFKNWQTDGIWMALEYFMYVLMQIKIRHNGQGLSVYLWSMNTKDYGTWADSPHTTLNCHVLPFTRHDMCTICIIFLFVDQIWRSYSFTFCKLSMSYIKHRISTCPL